MNSTTVPFAALAALERLIDYAGLFPPAQLPMNGALGGYDAAAAGRHAWMLGRFIVPVARLHEVPPGIAVSVIVRATDEAFAALDTLRANGHRIESLEVPPAAPQECARLRSRYGWDGVPVYLEVPARSDSATALDGVAGRGLGAKLRCGGVEPSMYPSVTDVAGFIKAAAAARIVFKATAGLHHPVRHYNQASGVVMHGFLNVFTAAVFPDDAPAIIAEEDASAFSLTDGLRWRERRADAAHIAAVRSSFFAGYGSCSFDEPVADLQALGMLAS